LDENFDFITLIDVIQHIVNEDKFNFALKNIAQHLNFGGTFFIGPLTTYSKKVFFMLMDGQLKKCALFLRTGIFNI
jgi:2-polyprenyl-3-methyl-5-hydroxy-6-metoxy-1,4-benzoquinol methylase